MRFLLTGSGSISPYGIGTAVLADGVHRKHCALATDEAFAFENQTQALVGLVNEGETDAVSARVRRMPKCNRMALMASEQALRDSCLDTHELGEEVGIFFCTDHGPESQTCRFLDTLLLKSPRLVSPLLFQNTTFAAGGGEVSMQHQIRGPSYTVVSGFHGFYTAIDLATMALSLGRIRYALIVATDELTPIQYRSLVGLGMARRQTSSAKSAVTSQISQNVVGNGFIPAEGAGAVVIETEATSETREVNVLGQLFGVGHGHDAQAHRRTSQAGEGLHHAMEQALKGYGESCIELASVDAVYLAANGLAAMDEAEQAALLRIGAPLVDVPHFALKDLIGESHAAAPALQLIAALHNRTSVKQRILLNAQSPGGGAASLIVDISAQ